MTLNSYLGYTTIEKRANLPVFLMFCIFPLISITAKVMGIRMLNYDPFWMAAFAVACLPFPYIASVYKKLVLILVLLVFFKFGVPIIAYTGVNTTPWMMDIKWLIYLAFSILWISKNGFPNSTNIYKCSLFFSKVYVLFTLFRYLVWREDVSRDGILMEANYDGFMILMGFCFCGDFKKNKKDFLIFALATLCTMSRTGFMAFALMVLYKYMRRNILYLIPLVPVLLFAAEYAMSIRGSESATHLDRFVYFEQAYLYLSNTDVFNVLFGSTPGKSLDMVIMPEFAWNVSNFEEMRKVDGVYPFMFHSAYLRLALTWGIIAPLAFLFFFIRWFVKSNNESFKVFSLLVIVQSISLSTLTLQNVSVLFFLMLLMFVAKEKTYTSNEVSNYENI